MHVGWLLHHVEQVNDGFRPQNRTSRETAIGTWTEYRLITWNNNQHANAFRIIKFCFKQILIWAYNRRQILNLWCDWLTLTCLVTRFKISKHCVIVKIHPQKINSLAIVVLLSFLEKIRKTKSMRYNDALSLPPCNRVFIELKKTKII